MSATQYSGLCIGGPMAGQRSAVWCSTMWVESRPPAVVRIDQPDPIPFEPFPSPFVYRHVAMHFLGDDGPTQAGFWVPEDVPHPRRFVLEELARFYEEAHAKKDAL